MIDKITTEEIISGIIMFVIIIVLIYIIFYIFWKNIKSIIKNYKINKKKKKYTFSDKFLFVEKEKRINNKQFSIRSLLIMILSYIPILILHIIIIFIEGIGINISSLIRYIPILQLLLFSIIIFIFFPKIIEKRSHDFNNNGIFVKKIFFLLYGLIFLLFVLILMGVFYIKDIFHILIILSILLYGNLLYLSSKPGTKGINNYGKEISNIK